MISPYKFSLSQQNLSELLMNLQDEEIEDSTPSPVKKIDSNTVFREYYKTGEGGNFFEATDKYYVLDEENHNVLMEVDDERNKIYFCQKEQSYYLIHRKMNQNVVYDEREYIDLYIIKDIFLNEQTTKISKQELLLKFSLNNIEIDEKLLKDLYLNTYHFIKNQDNCFIQKHLRLNKRYIFATYSQQLPTPHQQIYE